MRPEHVSWLGGYAIGAALMLLGVKWAIIFFLLSVICAIYVKRHDARL